MERAYYPGVSMNALAETPALSSARWSKMEFVASPCWFISCWKGSVILCHERPSNTHHLLQTSRIQRDPLPSATPVAPVEVPLTPQPASVSVAQDQETTSGTSGAAVNALLSLLSTASALPPGSSSPIPNDVSQLFSALAGCYGINAPTAPPLPTSTKPVPPTIQPPSSNTPKVVAPIPTAPPKEVIEIKEEEEEIVEIQSIPATQNSSPSRQKKVLTSKENIPPGAPRLLLYRYSR